MLPGGDIHLRNLKDIKIFPKVLYKWVSDSLKSDLFSDPLKPAKITCTYKRKYLFVKDSCWPIGNISLIPNVLKNSYTAKFMAICTLLYLRIPTDS